jgi:thymidylate synthase (FAD)
MKIIKPSAEMLSIFNRQQGEFVMAFIEAAARISHGSEDKIKQGSWERLLQSVVMDHGDWSVVEHFTVSVLFKVDRGITHELVRHRLFSFTQSSTRFINYAKEKDGIVVHPAEFIYPKQDVECSNCYRGDEALEYTDGFFHKSLSDSQERCFFDRIWLKQIKSAEEAYKKLIIEGWRPQEARSVFPNALASTIQMTGNLRNWRHFFIMRTTAETHPQMKQVTIPLLEKFKEVIPMFFDDIIPGSRQIENLRKAR